MTPEEFKKRFKVGDKIRIRSWKDGEFVIILDWGFGEFWGENQNGDKHSWKMVYDWLPYIETIPTWTPEEVEGMSDKQREFAKKFPKGSIVKPEHTSPFQLSKFRCGWFIDKEGGYWYGEGGGYTLLPPTFDWEADEIWGESKETIYIAKFVKIKDGVYCEVIKDGYTDGVATAKEIQGGFVPCPPQDGFNYKIGE